MKRRSALISFCLVALLAAPASGLMLEVPFDQVVLKSDVIAQGQIVDRQSFWTPDGHTIMTKVTLRVDEAWKGDVEPGAEITILTEGGEVGGMGIRTEHQPVFLNREHVVVFLKPPVAEVREVLHLEQGKFTVTGNNIVSFKGERRTRAGFKAMTLQHLSADPD